MTKDRRDPRVRLDINNPTFQENLFGLERPERLAILDTLSKRHRLTWGQVYRDTGLKWEKIASIWPPPGIPAIYSLRIIRSRRATAYRDGDVLRFLTIAPDHDSTYGKK